MPALPASLSALRRRDFRLMFGAQAVSGLGDRMVPVALAFAVLGLGGSPSEVGIVLAARTLPLVGSLLIGGVVADRVSRRTVMMAADLVRVASQGVTAALLVAGSSPVWALAVLAGVTGAGTGFFNPASVGLLPLVVAREELQQANGLRATAMAGGEIVGPIVGGILIATAGPGWALGVDAATFAASAALLAGVRLPVRDGRPQSSFLADLREGWGAFRARSWLWSFVCGAAAGNLLWGAWSVLGPVVAQRDLGGAAVWGAVLGAMGAGTLAGALLSIRARPRRPLVYSMLATTTFAIPLVLLALRAPVLVLGAGAALVGAGMMLSNSVWESTLQREVPPGSLSRLSAYDWFGSFALQPVGLAVWGPIAAVVGITPSLWAAAVLLAASTFAVLAVPEVRAMRSGERPVAVRAASDPT